jgi:uncharacterized membrane protein
MPAEDPAARNVEDIARLERQVVERISPGERIAKRVTDLVGTPGSAFLHLAVFAAWIVWNVGWIPGVRPFDPYPFGFLTMFVSYEAAVVSIFVLITQNRMMKASDRRDRLALQVDMLAEQEMTMVLRTLARICERLGVDPAPDADERHRSLMEETNVYELMEKVDQKFGKP